VKPSGRINACMAVGRDTLYLYVGMMEVKDREITLDDLYSLNLSKFDEWKCIIPVSCRLAFGLSFFVLLSIAIYFTWNTSTCQKFLLLVS
jgi:hypothetical protein